jgi:putative ABC transport system permease protein
MLRNYFKIAWRNALKNRTSSFINISGLAVGMSVATLIGLWIWDELSFNKNHSNYDRIAIVMEKDEFNVSVNTNAAIPLPLDAELRKSYGTDFKHIAMASWTEKHILMNGDRKISFQGNFMGAEAPEILSLKMIRGSRNGLAGPSSILLSQSVSKALFREAEPMGQVVSFDNQAQFKVSGVYEDLPLNSSFHDLAFIGPWDYYIHSPGNIRSPTDWGDNSLFMYVQIGDHSDMAKLSEKIKDIKLVHAGAGEIRSKPEIFLQPMSKWHLYSEFKNGINVGGAIQYVWLFGIIAIFVLLLACINFMNLSTARSEKRSKEVGIRKAVGSLRGQLVRQFYLESLLIALLAFALALILVYLAFPFFNELSGKNLSVLWSSPIFWILGLGFTILTGLIAGSYPAIYLSSFQPVRVLKGAFKAGRFAALPRKALVVVQFIVSLILIVGTVIVYKQIQFAKDRPVGYSRDGLVTIEVTNYDLHSHFNSLRADLLQSGAITEIAESSSPTTGVNHVRGDLSWTGKDPTLNASFAWIGVTSQYGKTVGWQFTQGRDFSSAFISDSQAVILNQTAVKYMGLKDPVGQTIKVRNRDLTVIGVVKDMVMESPYDPIKQSIFYIGRDGFDYVILKINPHIGAHEALAQIKSVCKIYSPSVPFSYRFADDDYARKFAIEERIGKLSSFFTLLALFISCLGLFGMASFMAEQRMKEIGVRKVLGASLSSVWALLSWDFVALLLISLLVAFPISFYFMQNWLQGYLYHTEISWWVFAAAALRALVLTLFTVSYQAIKAGLANPVKSLRME